MKKFFAGLLGVMMILSMVACSGGGDANNAQDSTEAEQTTETTSTVEENGETTTEPIRVALLCASNLGDMSFYDSANEGITRAANEGKAETRVIECNDDISKFEPTLIDVAEEGFDLIIVPYQFQDYVEKHAGSYPESTFILFDTEFDFSKGDYSNVYCVLYQINEVSFLGGYLAAKMTVSGAEGTNEEKIIGFLGGMDQPIINDFLIGYIEGAQYADPETKVLISYVNSYTDAAKGKELSLAMFNQGMDVGFNVAGGAGTGLIEAAVEKNGFVIGVDSDQAMAFKDTKPEFSAVIPTSILKNVGDSLYRAIDLYIKGELKLGENEVLGISEGGVGLADNEFYQSMISEELRNEIAALQEKIIAGEIQVGTALGMSTDELNTIRDSVKP